MRYYASSSGGWKLTWLHNSRAGAFRAGLDGAPPDQYPRAWYQWAHGPPQLRGPPAIVPV